MKVQCRMHEIQAMESEQKVHLDSLGSAKTSYVAYLKLFSFFYQTCIYFNEPYPAFLNCLTWFNQMWGSTCSNFGQNVANIYRKEALLLVHSFHVLTMLQLTRVLVFHLVHASNWEIILLVESPGGLAHATARVFLFLSSSCPQYTSTTCNNPLIIL